MTAAVVTLAIALAGALAAVIALAWGRLADLRQLNAAQLALAQAERDVTAAQTDAEVARRELAAERAAHASTNDALDRAQNAEARRDQENRESGAPGGAGAVDDVFHGLYPDADGHADR